MLIRHFTYCTVLRKGESIARESKDGIIVMKWEDKRDVMLLTTRHTDEVVATGKKDRQGNDIRKLDAMLFYNGTKQGMVHAFPSMTLGYGRRRK